MARSATDTAPPGPTARQARRLHEDGNHRVTLFAAPGGSDRAVVCFEAGRDVMNGYEPTTCPRFAERLGIDALTVQTARRDWFLSDTSDALAAALDAATVGYADVCATGFSMGGYGALLYSRAAHLRRVLAVSPQYSIDPAIAPYDPGRHEKFARIGRDMPLPEARGDTALRGVVIYDPTIPADRAHVQRIRAAFPHLKAVALPHGGHPATGVVAEAGGIGTISTMLVQRRLDAGRIRRMHRAARHASPRYRLSLASAAAAHHAPRAVVILQELARDAVPKLRLEACLALLTLDPDAGTAALSRLLDDVPDAPPSWAKRIARAVARN
ncbi:hypothetical protein [Paracoccus laeviglucosivorans]|uniref:Alpha/beta hydrolase n=1 Tax=Paracoccus laeviglucosivorans TaxID=1197861 RepID=A0A521CFE2_9RHOB|nr:hypothetical protein [Paracoccus laeviglucosivorans]SMO58154.1 hypothetical protein SAMN06265221_104271 [Paracoccus laeviglucosivorans]